MPVNLDFEGTIEDIRAFLEKTGRDIEKAGRQSLFAVSKQHHKRKKGQQRKNKPNPLRIDRFRNVFAKPLQDLQNFVAPIHPKTKAQREMLDGALADNFIFLRLDLKTRDALVTAMEPIHYKKDFKLITQGELGDFMYVIEKGVVRFEVDGKPVGKGEAGQCFGELALLYDCPRAATVVCDTHCKLWRVNQVVVRKLKAARIQENNKEARDLVRKVGFLKELSESHKHKIADALEKEFFEPNQVMFEKGKPCEYFVLIKEGTVKGTDVTIGETRFEDLTLTAGDFFGQSMIESGKPWIGNVKAETHVIAYQLSRSNFIRILGGFNLEKAIAKSREQRLLAAIPILANSDINPIQIKLMQELIVPKTFHRGHVFMKQGQIVEEPAIYLIRSGSISVSTGGSLGGSGDVILKTGEFFGDDSLISDEVRRPSKGVVAKNTIVAMEGVTCGVLALKSIGLVFWDVSRLGKAMTKNAQMDDSISLQSLERHKILGAGTFGQVWLVSQKQEGKPKSFIKSAAQMSINKKSSIQTTKTPYALKIQYKRDLIRYNQVEGVLNEKKVMEMIDHPFVIRLVNSYKDQLRVYMLLQLVQGGELFSLIHTDEYDGIPEDEAVFYAAGILEGLSYMHRRNILHRDLKGENVLMDSDGYCVLIDLGFAKVVPDKTYTCCGTPIFMAPEVLLGEGHDAGADYWSLGVLIFDAIVGYTPFYIPGMKQMELYERIVRGKFYWPDDIEVIPEAKNLIQNLLLPDPAFRLGCLARGDMDIRDHSFFESVDFRKLFRKELKAPWVPEIKDPFDVSQFEDWSELENKKKDLKPLTKKEQELFDRF